MDDFWNAIIFSLDKVDLDYMRGIGQFFWQPLEQRIFNMALYV